MDNKDWNKIFHTIGLLTQLGIVMVVNIALGFIFGNFIDEFMGVDIIFKIIGLIIGIVSGFYSNYRLIKVYIDNNNDDS